MKIISGGQTGVDRGALDAALQTNVDCGGWCPEHRLAEDGPIPGGYPLTVLPGAGYPERTRQNVIDSDGTLIITFGPIEGGTAYTLNLCRRLNKPNCVIDMDNCETADPAECVVNFIDSYAMSILNVAGPRASKVPEAQHRTMVLMTEVLQRLKSKSRA